MVKLLIHLLLLGYSFSSKAQMVRIECASSKGEVIPYAHLFIKKNGEIVDGWLSNKKGLVTIDYLTTAAFDTLFLSAMGYEEQAMAFASLDTTSLNRVSFKETAFTLPEIVIMAGRKKDHSELLGTFKNQKWRGSWHYSNKGIAKYYGRMLAAHVKNTEKKQGYIHKVKIKLAPGSEPNDAIIRLVIFSVDTNKYLPAEAILNKTILLIQHTKTQRWLEADLSESPIILPNEGLYIGLQSLPADTISYTSSSMEKDLAILKSKDKEAINRLLNHPKIKVQMGGFTDRNFSNTWVKQTLTGSWERLSKDDSMSSDFAPELIVKAKVVFYK